MSAAEDARVEAKRRWGAEPTFGMSAQFHAGLCDGMVTGAEWQASRPITDAQVEAAARVLYGGTEVGWRTLTNGWKTRYRDNARAALEVARGVRS